MDRLGVQRSTVALWGDDPRLRPGTDHVAVLEWTINAVPLSDIFENGPYLPLLHEGAHPSERTETLHRLRGDRVDRPVFTQRFDRSPLDRLLRRKGTPWAFSGPAFEDGRVCLLECPCSDLDCGALTTEVVISDGTVEWRDIGWQVTYEPFAEFNDVLQSAMFDRDAYNAVIDSLLSMDWTDFQ